MCRMSKRASHGKRGAGVARAIWYLMEGSTMIIALSRVLKLVMFFPADQAHGQQEFDSAQVYRLMQAAQYDEIVIEYFDMILR